MKFLKNPWSKTGKTSSKKAVPAGVITNLQDHFVIAMPSMEDPNFQQAVIYICNHSDDEGAMGLVVNRPIPEISFREVVDSMGIDENLGRSGQPIIFSGGPVDANRGFVVHSDDYFEEGTMRVGTRVSLSATADIVEEMAEGRGPRHANFCLGYAGWEPGQLESEIAYNTWLVMPANDMILFDMSPEKRYEACLKAIGLTSLNFFEEAGEA